MTETRALFEREFEQCWSQPMRNVSDGVPKAINIWPYVDALNPTDIGVKRILDVSSVYRDSLERYDHVLIETDLENVILVVVVDVAAEAIFGHHLLDLNIKYGPSTPH